MEGEFSPGEGTPSGVVPFGILAIRIRHRLKLYSSPLCSYVEGAFSCDQPIGWLKVSKNALVEGFVDMRDMYIGTDIRQKGMFVVY